MKILILLAVAFSPLVYSGGAKASNPVDRHIPETVQAVEVARESLVAAARNLTGMRNSLPSSEGEAVQKVISEAWLVFESAGRIVTVGDIYVKMKTTDDMATVSTYFSQAAKHYRKQVDLSLPWLNECLVRIKTPAALAEATNVRDKMIEASTAVQLFEAT
jgi:hypothetical protein